MLRDAAFPHSGGLDPPGPGIEIPRARKTTGIESDGYRQRT